MLDIRMSNMSGLEVLPQIRADHPNVAVIMFTGLDDLDSAVEAMREGAYDYITKPVRLQELLVRIEKAREQRDLAIQLQNHQRTLEDRLAEQAEDLRRMISQTVSVLIKEAAASQEIQPMGRKRKAGIHKGTDIRKFGAEVLKRFRSGSDGP